MKIASISCLAFSFICLIYLSDSFFFLPKFDIYIDGIFFCLLKSFKQKLFSSSLIIFCSLTFFISSGDINSYSYSTIIYYSYPLNVEFEVALDFSTSYFVFSESRYNNDYLSFILNELFSSFSFSLTEVFDLILRLSTFVLCLKF